MRAAIWHLGGLGDLVDTAHMGLAIRNSDSPSFLAAYVSSPVQHRLISLFQYRGLPLFDYVIVTSQSWDDGVTEQAQKWDVMYDWKPYVGAKWTPHGEDGDMFPEMDSIPAHLQDSYDHMLSVHTNDLVSLGKKVHEIGCESFGIDPVPIEWLEVNLPTPVDRVLRLVGDRPYITINNGSDTGVGGRIPQTKEWDIEKWVEVVESVKASHPDLAVFHIGASGEPAIPGTVNLVGLTSVEDMLVILRSSILHLGAENGAVRLAKAVGTNSVVVYGPTSPVLYSLSGNSTMHKNVCPPCFWKTGDWMTECPNGWAVMCLEMLESSIVATEVLRRLLGPSEIESE